MEVKHEFLHVVYARHVAFLLKHFPRRAALRHLAPELPCVGLVWFWFGLVLVWFGLVWFGLVWFGSVWFWCGLVWFYAV